MAHAQDFHSGIEGALSNEEYVRELYGAMLEEAAAELAAGQERAVARTLRKAELKVRQYPAPRQQPCMPELPSSPLPKRFRLCATWICRSARAWHRLVAVS